MTDLNQIDLLVGQKNFIPALQLCLVQNQPYLALFIAQLNDNTILKNSEYYQIMAEIAQKTNVSNLTFQVVKKSDLPQPVQNQPVLEPSKQIEPITPEEKKTSKIRVQLLCNWCCSQDLAKLWNKMTKGNFCWNNIELVWSNPVDYFVVINAVPPGVVYDRRKTFVFRMEPHMAKHPEIWGNWADPDPKEFLGVFKHETRHYNNNEWHLSKTYTELTTEKVEKDNNLDGIVSTILSSQYRDIGHVRRIDFVKFLEKKGLTIHVFGDNKFNYVNFKGSLPSHTKDKGLFPYKYTFNAENNSIPYYYTEKLIDGILAECLTFYWGCPNAREFIDERAYVQLTLSNFEQDYDTIRTAIKEDWWSQRIQYIREAKQKILNELQFFPRLEKIIAAHSKES